MARSRAAARSRTAARRPRVVPGVGRETAAEKRARLERVVPMPPPAPQFDAREALRRSGLAAGDDLAKTAGLAGDLLGAGSRWWRSDPSLRPYHPVSFAELAVFGAASLLGLALLDTALRGRGPAGVEALLGGLGAGVRRLFDPRDPLVPAAEAPPFTPPGLGGPAARGPRAAEAAGGGAGVRSATKAGGVYPLGQRGKIIGTPNAGTHNLGNWQSDNAVDLAVPVGTPVYAVTSGRISSSLGYGQMASSGRFAGARLHLESDDGNAFFYAHLSRIVVPRGARVREGQLIGYSGTANGVPHLHFGVKQGSPFAWAEAQVRRAARAVRRAVGARER